MPEGNGSVVLADCLHGSRDPLLPRIFGIGTFVFGN